MILKVEHCCSHPGTRHRKRTQTSSPHNFSILPERAGSARTTRSQEQARANRTFKGLELSLRPTEDRIRGFKGSSASIEHRQLRDSLQHARQAVDPYDNLELTMELQRERTMEYITSNKSVFQPHATQFGGSANEIQTDMLREMKTCTIRLNR